MVGSGRAGFIPWYAALNNGLHITAVGGEDSISNLHAWKLVGSQRTYVFSCDRGSHARRGSRACGRATPS